MDLRVRRCLLRCRGTEVLAEVIGVRTQGHVILLFHTPVDYLRVTLSLMM